VKLVHIFGFIIRIYHDARSPERQVCFFSNLDKEFVSVSYGGEVCVFVCLMCMYVAVQYNSTEREFERPILISVQLLVFRKYSLRVN